MRGEEERRGRKEGGYKGSVGGNGEVENVN